MFTILLLILKIIGIVLLVLLSLFVILLLTVLFVPIRYRMAVEHGERLDVEGTISWLLHMIHAHIAHKDGRLHIRLRIFGRIFYDNLRIVKTKKTKRKLKRKLKRKVTKVKREVNQEIAKNIVLESSNQDCKEEAKSKLENQGKDISDNLIELSHQNELETKASIDNDDHETSEEIISFLQKLNNKIKNLWNNIKRFFIRIRDKVKSFIAFLRNLNRIRELVVDFFGDNLNKEVCKLSVSSIIKIFKHILPTKLKSRVVFGTGDPCTTGQALGVIGILYSFYGNNIQIIPDFESKRLEGNHFAKGRIRLFTILIIGIKLILDRRFKQFTKNIKTFKEAL